MRDLFDYLCDTSVTDIKDPVPDGRDAFCAYARERLTANRPVGLVPTAVGMCLRLADGTMLTLGPALKTTDEMENVPYAHMTEERWRPGQVDDGRHVGF